MFVATIKKMVLSSTSDVTDWLSRQVVTKVESPLRLFENV